MKKAPSKYAGRLAAATLVILVVALSLLPTAPVRNALERGAGGQAEAEAAPSRPTRGDAPAASGETHSAQAELPAQAGRPAREEHPARAERTAPAADARKGGRKIFDIARAGIGLDERLDLASGGPEARREPEPEAGREPGRELERGTGRELGRETEREREREAKPEKPDKAVAWRRLHMVDENGHIPDGALMRAWEQAKRMPVEPGAWPVAPKGALPSSEAGPVAGLQPAGWTWLGPGNIGGRIRSIVVHPTDPQTLWVGSVGGGIWKTTNGGAHWSPLTDFMASLAVGSMAIDPTNPNVLYAGTGEGFFNSDALRGAGVFKTTDGGATWARLPATATSNWHFVNRLSISPADSQIILAATQSGIWRSADGGATWSRRTTANVHDINFHPADGAKAVASGNGTLGAIYSVDGGLTWNTATGLPPLSGFLDRVEVAYARSDPSIVYASVNVNGGDLFRSTNGGQSYTLVNTGTGFLGAGWYNNIIWVDPTNANVVVVGGLDLWRSTNGGANLTQISQWFSAPQSAHADHHVIVESAQYDGATNKTVYFGNDGGIYRANDVHTVSLTTGWTELNNNLGITQFYGGAGHPASGRIIGGTQDNGTLRFTGGTENWNTTFGGDGGWSAADPTDPNYLYGEYVGLRIHRSTNGGISSNYIYPGITDVDANLANFIAPFVLDPNNPNTLLAGGSSLWRSTNVKAALPTWAAIKTPAGANISAIAVAPGNSDIIWVGHNNGEVYFTTNGTAALPTWTRADTGATPLPGRYCTRLTIDPTNSSRVYATFGGFNANNVWRTNDGGTTWANVTGNLPAAPVRTLAVWRQNPNNIYVGTEVGIFASADGGQSWSPSNDGPTNCSVDELFWMNDTLVAVTHGRGMFSINVATTGQPPTVSLTSPAAGAVFAAPASVPLAATAADADGSVTSVEFFANGNLVGTDATSPYTATWSNVTGGSYNLTARATDNSGNTATSPSVTISVTGDSGPPNNNFASAQTLVGSAGVVTGTNVGANKEAGEPTHANPGGASIWYRWQATASGVVVINTAGSTFDTLLAVYTGASLGGLAHVASNDDAAFDRSSRVEFNVVAGTTYRIAVDGFGGATGSTVLAWNFLPTCTFTVSPTSPFIGGSGGTGSVTVTAGAGCAWTAVSNAEFITVTGGASGSGGGTVSYSLPPYVGPRRTGTITVAGQTVTVTQDGSPCLYALSATSQSFSANAGAGFIGIDTLTGCSWSAVSNSSFITITGATSGIGDGTTSYFITAHNGSSPRTGTLTVAGHTFTVTQAARDPGNCPSTSIIVNQALVNGTLSTADCRGTDGRYFDNYAFSGTAGQQVIVALSGGYDTYLRLSAPGGSLLAEDNDGGGGTNSRIPASAGSITLPATGVYTIAVTSSAQDVTGSYGLLLSEVVPNATVQFSSATYSANEGGNSATVTVTRTGDTAAAATVAYTTVDDPAAVPCATPNGVAYARCDYATTLDTLQFAPAQTQASFTIPLINDTYVEGPETLTLRLSDPSGARMGGQSLATLTILDNDATPGPNPIDASPFFVRLQYLDFLSREPDADGFAAWLGVLDRCPNRFNSDPLSLSAGCDRNIVTSSFFRSAEFELKGRYAFLFYKVSFGRLPQYVEITTDMRSLTGQTQAEVFARRAAFPNTWTQRPAFQNAYNHLSNAAYVDALLGRYGAAQITTPDPANPEGEALVTLTRAELTSRLNAATMTRAQVLRALVQSREVDAREYNGAFVAMQYYGYLRRAPEPSGYEAWLDYLNRNPTDFRTMVDGFMNSVEYRLRFGAQ